MTPLVINVEDTETHAKSQHAFIKSPVRLGRSELNDLPIPQGFVSSWHAVVQFDDKEIRYVDLGSTNGSMLDGHRLDKNAPALLTDQSEIRIGTLSLRFARRTTGTRTAAPRALTQFAMRVSELRLPQAPAPGAGPAPSVPAMPEAPPPPAAEPAQVEMVEQALAAAAMDLDLLYASYRGTWEQLRHAIDQLLVGMDDASRSLAVGRLAEKYEALAQEPQFQVVSGTPAPASGTPAPAREPAAVSGAGGKATRLLAAFAQSYLPSAEGVATEKGMEKLLGRAAEVLEAYSKSYVELRKGYEEFGKEMGVRTVRGDSPVERARDAKQLLAFLLDLRAEGRISDLQSAFADLMVHQVAMLNGVVEGARGILTRLDPNAVAEKSGGGMWPMKAAQQWKTYEESWHEIADEEDSISDALFGTEFARAYSAIVGQRTGESEKDAPGRAKRRSTPRR